ncbi:MAG: hypothetical protein L7H18_03125 [Candidatus Nealsonbacteria bacterium DGGOD1a]|jgi:hypothetical protein|nr:MAG: hypothetical protein L7H18_03125 [Candidatus Nealsonbacteria bacterium DGGOD1a]
MNKKIILLTAAAVILAGMLYLILKPDKETPANTVPTPNESNANGKNAPDSNAATNSDAAQIPQTQSPGQNDPTTTTVCTMEAKICPDGSAVGRTGLNCEFAPCPETNSRQTACTEESREGDVCNEIYSPVCATVRIQCVKAPCNPIQQTFSNACIACHNPLVSDYAMGECPK